MINRNLSVGYLVNNLEFDLKGEFLVGVFWTPNEFLLFHSLTIFKKFFVNLFQEYAFIEIADNGKGLCEVRATATGSGEENRTLAKTFSIF